MTLHIDSGGAPMRRPDIDALIARLVSRRDEAEYLADKLIEALDAADGDCDLEDGADDEPDVDDELSGDEREPSLGAPDVEFKFRGLPERRGHIDQRRWWDGGCRHGEDEPALGATETHSLVQDEWSHGCKRNPDHEECEAVSEDEGACIQSQPHDGHDVEDCCESERGEPLLGSLDRRMDQRGWAGEGGTYSSEPEADRSDYEPSLGSLEGLPHRVDQRRWGYGESLDREPNGDELDEDCRDMPRTEAEVMAWPASA